MRSGDPWVRSTAIGGGDGSGVSLDVAFGCIRNVDCGAAAGIGQYAAAALAGVATANAIGMVWFIRRLAAMAPPL